MNFHIIDIYANNLNVTTGIHPVTLSTVTAVVLSAYSQTPTNIEQMSHYT